MMDMAIYFIFLFYQCDEVKRRIILRNMFLISFVSEYTISIRNDSIYFNLYSNSVYYQYVFRLKKLSKKNGKYVASFKEDRIRCFIILVDLNFIILTFSPPHSDLFLDTTTNTYGIGKR